METRIKPLLNGTAHRTLSIVKTQNENPFEETRKKIEVIQGESQKRLKGIENNVNSIKAAIDRLYNSPNSIVAKKEQEKVGPTVKVIPKKATNKTLKPHGVVKYFFRGMTNHIGEKIQYDKLLAAGINGNLLFLSQLNQNKTDVLIMNPAISELSFFSTLSKKVNFVLQQKNRLICDDLIYTIEPTGFKLLQ